MLPITATEAQPSADTDQLSPDGLPDLSTTPTDPAEAADTEHTVAKPALPGDYELLPIKQIRPNPDNVRDDAQALPGIVGNLQQDGVRGLLAPVIVTPLDDDTYLIIDGEQRYWSAVEAEQEYLPAIVRDDLAGNREQIISMLRQVHRKDPTAAQQARGIQQLALDGMSDEEIARSTGYHPEQVKAGRCVAALDKHTAERTHALGLDFTQAAALAEFTDEPDTIGTLLEEAEDGGPFAFARAVEQARSARNARETEAARRAELTAAGVTLLPEHPGYHDAKVKEICDLRDAEGQHISAEDHSACPGHAVLLYLAYDHRLTERTYCTDWRKHGHTQYSYSTTTRSGPMTEQEKAERRRIIENNKLMEAANTVRREWLTNLLAGKTPPKGTNKLIAEMLADSGYTLSTWINGGRKMLDYLLSPGKTKRAGTSRVPARVSDARYTVISLAAIAAANESAITRSSWRAPDPAVAKWLQWCITNGFQIGKVEQLIIDGVTNRTTNRRTELTVATTNTEPDDPKPTHDKDEPEQPDTATQDVDAATSATADSVDTDEEADPDTAHRLAA